MTPARLRHLGAKLWPRGWQTRMSEALHVHPTTVRRWVSGKIPVPGPVAAALECMAREHAKG